MCPYVSWSQERREALAAGRPVPQDLLGVLLTAADEAGHMMTDEELWEDVHDVSSSSVRHYKAVGTVGCLLQGVVRAQAL